MFFFNLNLSNFNTNNVNDMSFMFFYCSSLTFLDLSNFNTNDVNDMNNIFFNISKKCNINNNVTCIEENLKNNKFASDGCNIF